MAPASTDLRDWTPKETRRRIRRLLLGVTLSATIIGTFFGGLAAYAGMWPPLLVVESGSMQHNDTTSELGILDTGDLAVVQAIRSPDEIVTYLEGRATGYASFGDFGDVIVIVFLDPDLNETRALLHRAFAFVTRNASGGYDVPELAALPGSAWTGIAKDGSVVQSPYGLQSFSVFDMGWRRDSAIEWNLTQLAVKYPNDGFLTFGDNNLYRRPTNKTDPWILDSQQAIARVRGEIPWLGLLRLTVSKSPDGCCASWGLTDPDSGAPGNSWLALDVLLAVGFGTPILVDVVLRRAAVWTYLSSLFRVPSSRASKRGAGSRERPSRQQGSNPLESAPSQVAAGPSEIDFETWLASVDERIQRLRGLLREQSN